MTDTSHFEKCRKSMNWLKRTTKWRFIITAFSLVINSLMYFIHMFTKATVEWSAQNTYLSFVFLLASLVLGAYLLYLAGSAAAYPEKTRTLCILMAVLILARLTSIVLNVFTFLIPLWATQFFQIRKARWLIEQEGYPYFSERFEEQKKNTEYVPPYPLDSSFHHKSDHGIIPDTIPETPVSARVQPEMPGIPDFPDLPEQ